MYSPALLDLDITVISAKHLKNVNWRNGDLKPYATFSLDHDPHLRLSTRPDDSGSTRPVWNEILTIPLTAASPADAILIVEVFHSKPSETPKPLVGSSRFPLSHLTESDGDAPRVYALDLYRPSGRPQGKLRVKLAVRERPRPPPPRYHDYAPEDRGNYFTPPPFSQFNHSVPCSGYSYGHYYYARPPPPPPPSPPIRPFSGHASNYGASSVPTAPVDFSPYAVDHKPTVPSGYSSPYCPSAPVDFSYPVQEHRPIPLPRYTASAPAESLSSEHLIPTPRWILNHRASAPVYPSPSNSRSSDNLVPNEPAAPSDSSRCEQRPLPRCEDVGSALGRLNLEEGNARETDYVARSAPGYGHYQSGC
ncbi:C2 domain-containing protein [Psidium guajava]|nr:C2 domain-containing protein [Psidium guajava]